MDTQDFKDLMTAHDSLIYPEYYKDGWDGALKAILEEHPGAFVAADFHCPPVTLPEGTYVAEDRVDDDVASPGSSATSSAATRDEREREKTPPRESTSTTKTSKEEEAEETDDTATSKG